ncbi:MULTISPECIES: fumarylacetoacetate hydrolase family protein [unclassified Streptomyces]|uniref:fumarylacetoacetate hydrolase family protein n=1 Tax=unclassified Streptomyces TaxID=2593676 RepID=UPI00403CB8EE
MRNQAALTNVAAYTGVNHVAAGSRLEGVPATTVATAVGPALVTTDDVPTGGRGLTVTCVVDGRVTQKANTSELIFDVATVIAHVSGAVTLLPGDLITTGTPAGAGGGLVPESTGGGGAEVISVIKGVGELGNTLVGAWPR